MTLDDYKKLSLPDTPGVYFFRDRENVILYVGKATSLKTRVRSYFDADLIATRGLKIVSMVQNASTVSFVETGSVLEALILEAKYIKQYDPYFNTKEKDDTSFYSVVITKEEYPRVLLMRTRNIEKEIPDTLISKVYGPFTSGSSIKDALKIIRKMFPYRDTCVPHSGVACFNAQIGLCPGVCTDSITAKEYKDSIQSIMLFLDGKTKTLEKRLEKKMMEYAAQEKFEDAQLLKNSLFHLTHIKDTALIKRDNENEGDSIRIESYDVAHISGTSRVAVMTVVIGGEVIKSEYKKFKLEQNINNDVGAYKELFNRRFKHTEWGMPDIIVVDGGLPQKNIAEQILKMSGHGSIPVISVVKNEKHKPKGLLGPSDLVKKYKKDILLSNDEAHRFAIAYHKLLRSKSSLGK